MRTKYSPTQIKELKKHPYIDDCSNIYLTFNIEAKKKAIKLSERGLTAKQVFTEFKLPDYIINSETPARCLCRWRKMVRLK